MKHSSWEIACLALQVSEYAIAPFLLDVVDYRTKSSIISCCT